MNAAQFDEQFNRLKSHFHLGGDLDKGALGVEWFQAVEHYHIDALDHAVTMLIRGATDRFWPALGKLLEIIRGRIAGMDKTHDHCATCHGSTWVEAWPMRSREGHVYEFMSRCPDCGVPAPQGGTSTFGLTALSKSEYHLYKSGDWVHPPMPDGLGAKPRPKGDPALMQDAMNRLRLKLFGAERKA